MVRRCFRRTFWTLACLFVFVSTAVSRPAIVVIDPGHGGHDRGGIPGQRFPEKLYTLDTAQRLTRILTKDGIKVVLTRDSDEFVSLGQRTDIANQFRGMNAVFISLHFNSAAREGAFGIETYCNGLKAYRLALLIHPRAIEAMRSIDRGIRFRGYWVLRRNRLPAVLVEGGFLTNPEEAARITNPGYRERLAQSIAAGLLRY